MKTLYDDDPYLGDESDIPTETPDNGGVDPNDVDPGSLEIGDDDVTEGEENSTIKFDGDNGEDTEEDNEDTTIDWSGDDPGDAIGTEDPDSGDRDNGGNN